MTEYVKLSCCDNPNPVLVSQDGDKKVVLCQNCGRKHYFFKAEGLKIGATLGGNHNV